MRGGGRMSDRYSETILLCEDKAQARLVAAFLKRCGQANQHPLLRSLIASQMQSGGNDKWVLNQFPIQLSACRKRHMSKSNTRLIVAIDADHHSIDERLRQLLDRTKAANLENVSDNESVVLLIPKRNIETWIKCLLGETVNEVDDYKSWTKPPKEVFRAIADTLHIWSRPNATPGSNCVDSLRIALPKWKKIG